MLGDILRKGSAGLGRTQVAALDRAVATIEFSMDGTILRANDNFLAVVGYGLQEIQGRHHRMFVTAEDAPARNMRRSGAA